MLSIAINVKNGATHLEQCLNSLSRFEDVVLLDNYSTDATIAIAKKYANVRIFTDKFCGMGRLRNQVAGYAKYDWVFFVDSDEVVHPKLADKLLHMQLDNNCIYTVLRHNFYDNFRVDGCSWGNDWILRLYNRTETQYLESEVHESLNTNGFKVAKIKVGFLYHFPYDNVTQLINKMQLYSTLYAKQHLGKKNPKLGIIPFRAFFMFVKCYILKLGFLYGFAGLAISSYNAIGVFSKYLKLYELANRFGLVLAISFTPKINLTRLSDAINLQKLLPVKVLIIVDKTLADVFVTDQLKYLQTSVVVPIEVRYIADPISNIVNTITESLAGDDDSNLAAALIDDFTLLDESGLFLKLKQAFVSNKAFPGVTFLKRGN